MRQGSEQGRRPRLTPAVADIRRAVRETLAKLGPSIVRHPEPRYHDAVRDTQGDPLPMLTMTGELAADVLVALSGGPDSLALAGATAFEAPRAGLRAGAVIVDHGLQAGSAGVAQRAAEQAHALGLAPVILHRVRVPTGPSSETGGIEAAARNARYASIDSALLQSGARAVLLGHTLDDQAETVLLGLARGAGAASLSGMSTFSPNPSGLRIRPLLGIRRTTTLAFCADSGLDPWIDPHNSNTDFRRVRVRQAILPLLESELGPGIAEALSRSADQFREDEQALHDLAVETIEDLVEHAEAGIAVSCAALAANPPALRHRVIRYVVESEFGVSLSRVQTLSVSALVTDWKGQKGVDLPGIRVIRTDGLLHFSGASEHTEGP